jgi:hypothetical protein
MPGNFCVYPIFILFTNYLWHCSSTGSAAHCEPEFRSTLCGRPGRLSRGPRNLETEDGIDTGEIVGGK